MIQREKLHVGGWYRTRQGAAYLTLELVSWITPYAVVMRNRDGKERDVNITKIEGVIELPEHARASA